MAIITKKIKTPLQCVCQAGGVCLAAERRCSWIQSRTHHTGCLLGFAPTAVNLHISILSPPMRSVVRRRAVRVCLPHPTRCVRALLPILIMIQSQATFCRLCSIHRHLSTQCAVENMECGCRCIFLCRHQRL